MKRLSELNPKWTGLLRPNSGEGLEFDCPNCGPKHRCVAYFSNPIDGLPHAPWQNPLWERGGDIFSELTLKPSIQYPCFHGWIEMGIYWDISESPIKLWNVTEQGELQKVSLSPLQATAMADSIYQQCKKIGFKS